MYHAISSTARENHACVIRHGSQDVRLAIAAMQQLLAVDVRPYTAMLSRRYRYGYRYGYRYRYRLMAVPRPSRPRLLVAIAASYYIHDYRY
eukprot:SAG11_NODE_2765_length_2998_cov_7.305278_4_plen_91_part_00